MEYITTFQRLQEVALGGKKLGDMKIGRTYQDFMVQAQMVVYQANVVNPKLCLAITYRWLSLSPTGMPEVVYMPTGDQAEWALLLTKPLSSVPKCQRSG